MNRKVGLGTRWGFVERMGTRGPFWTVEGGLPKGFLGLRIIDRGSGYEVDKLPMLGPWEDFADGQTFPSPEAAARFLVTKMMA